MPLTDQYPKLTPDLLVTIAYGVIIPSWSICLLYALARPQFFVAVSYSATLSSLSPSFQQNFHDITSATQPAACHVFFTCTRPYCTPFSASHQRILIHSASERYPWVHQASYQIQLIYSTSPSIHRSLAGCQSWISSPLSLFKCLTDISAFGVFSSFSICHEHNHTVLSMDYCCLVWRSAFWPRLSATPSAKLSCLCCRSIFWYYTFLTIVYTCHGQINPSLVYLFFSYALNLIHSKRLD